MDSYYFTFQSMTQAQTATAVLQQRGLSAIFMRAPKAISITGCGYAVKFWASDAGYVYSILLRYGVFPQKTFREKQSGFVEEVFL